MDLKALLSELKNTDDKVNYLKSISTEIGLLFIKTNKINKNDINDLLDYLVDLNKTIDLDIPEYQGLISQIANYYKSINDRSNLEIFGHLIYNKAQKAIYQSYFYYRDFNDNKYFIEKFESYLIKLTNILNDFENVETQVYDELKLFQQYAIKNYDRLDLKVGKETFLDLFVDESLVNKYPILTHYNEITLNVDFEPINDKIFKPNQILFNLLNLKIIEPIKKHPKTPNTNWHQLPMGIDKFVIRNEIINFGRSNFKEPFKEITSKQKVVLYAYFNMRKHLFTSLALFESFREQLLEINETGFDFVDFGCGPATSGLALVQFLYEKNNYQKVSLNYFGADISKSMLEFGKELMVNEMIDENSFINLECESIFDFDYKKQLTKDVILINACYLFANVNDDFAVKFAHFISDLCTYFKGKNIFFLFQNSIRAEANISYNTFKQKLSELKKISKNQISNVVEILYLTKVYSLYSPSREKVYFEILKL